MIVGIGFVRSLPAQSTFVVEPRVALGSGQPTGAAAVIDIDGDGRLDVAFCQQESGRVAILLRNQADLIEVSSTQVGAKCGTVVAADVDGDGRIDLVSFDPDTATLWYVRGRDDGSFGEEQSLAINAPARALAAADFNGDGRDDLVAAVSSGDAGVVEVHLSETDGGFGPAIVFPAPDVIAALAVADIDADGHADIVASRSTSTISVLFGRGDGTFAAQSVAVPTYADAIATADLDADARPELLVVHTSSNRMAILRPRDDRTFDTPTEVSLVAGPTQVVSGDFTGDGNHDVAVLLSGARSVVLLHGDGNGGLRRGRSFMAGADPRVVAALPLNEDGLMDLVVAGQQLPLASASLLVATGDGFVGVESLPHAGVAAAAVVADFNDDGTPDFAVALAGLARVEVVLSDPLGGVLAPVEGGALAFAVSRLQVGDFNGDLLPDIVATRSNGRDFTILRNLGAGRLMGTTQMLPGESLITGVVSADLNGDGHEDLLFTRQGGALSWLNGRGDGTFLAPVTIGLTRATEDPRFGDFNGDGRADLVMLAAAPSLAIALRHGDTFVETAPVTAGARTSGMAVADFNADGFDDLAVRDSADGQLRVYRGIGNGSFAAPQMFFVGAVAQGVAARDIDGDGDTDLLVPNLNGNEVIVLANNGQGGFAIIDRPPIGFRPNLVLAGDFDRDGAYDLLSVHAANGAAGLALNASLVRPRRGDANGDVRLSAADIVATVAELSDGDGTRVDDVRRFRRSFAGVDANGDGVVSRQDLRHTLRSLFLQ